ncbi:MAG TPA: histidine kinase, partial [Sunxiuqinia sp.]|nr:histidine kinase [Sunxiuqinia sp.]
EELAKEKESIESAGVTPVAALVREYLLHFDLAEHSDYKIHREGNRIKISKHVPYNKGNKVQEYDLEATVSAENGLTLESYSKSYVPLFFKKYQKVIGEEIEEKSFALVKNSKTYIPLLNLSGYIEKPEKKQIYINILNAPFGVEFDQYKATLNSENHFSINLPMTRPGFAFLSYVEDTNRIMNTTFKIIYAEPGDSIDFDLLGNHQKQYRFRGDRVLENTFLTQNFDSILNVNATPQGIIMPLLMKLQRKQKPYIPKSMINFMFSGKLKQDDFPEGVSAMFKDYLTHETQMLKFAIACNLQDFYHLMFRNQYTAADLQFIRQLNMFVDQFCITDYYEEYGYFSRNGVTAFAQNQFAKNDRFAYHVTDQNQIFAGYPMGVSYWADITKQNNYLNMILSGSSLFREKAELINRTFSHSSHFSQQDTQGLISKYGSIGHEIFASSRDSLLNTSVKKALKRAEEVFSGDIFKKKIFLSTNGDTVAIQDFLGKKATAICFTIANKYIYPQYQLQLISDKYPDLNIIIINDAEITLNKWEELTKTRNPDATHLYYLYQGYKLSKLFNIYPSSSFVMVFDRNGDLVEYAASINKINQYVEKALDRPLKAKSNELDKSTLYGIIWFLGGSLLLGLIAFLIYKTRVRLRLRKENREKRLQELQLSAIRAQMNPHFLFNSLNSVQNLIQKNQGSEAHLYLSDFAGLIRKVLKNSQTEEVSLAEELETLNQYIRLEQLRFDFEYEEKIDEQIDQNHFMVPSMILQPLAENAIMHGLQHKADNRKLQVEIKKLDKAIQISLVDNGIGLEASKKIKSVSNGIGLNRSEERLRIMQEKYGGNYSFKLIDLTQQGKAGTRVEIVVPEEE